MPPLSEMRFRASPHIELKQLSELTAEQREPLRDLESDPDCYGLFVPRPPLMMNLKSVGRQTAELFRTLVTPSRLDDESARGAIDLVLDGILEVESGEDFVSGADALALLSALPAPSDVSNSTARLSHNALLYAQDLETRDPRKLASSLYIYNRIPISPFWKTRFASREAILAYLGADRGPLRALLEREWVLSLNVTAWLFWSSRAKRRPREDEVTYKLYVSPRPERIRDAFEIAARVLSDFPEAQFKIGDSVVGLLRPDKFVAYFATYEQLLEAAGELRRELAGCEAHGVPFTAGLDDSGLLSWGIDPPDNDRALRWLRRESWRLWVANCLGAAISIAKLSHSASAVEPWRFAIERARRHGVDVETWTPSATLWSAA